MTKPHFIFDFDGTLIDSFQRVIKKFNLLSTEFNFRYINEDEIPDLKNLTSKELIKHLRIPLYKIPRVIIKARAMMREEMPKLLPHSGIKEVLQQIDTNNIKLGVLTSNSAEKVMLWLRKHKLQHLFSFIHIESNYFGKQRILKKIIKKYNLTQLKTYYIGDETRDIEAAKAAGIHAVAVTWGFNSEKILIKHHPHFIANEPGDIIKFLNL